MILQFLTLLKWKLRFLAGTALCTMQVLDPNTFLSKKDEMSPEVLILQIASYAV
jgi:hypothetical protein